MADCDHRLLMKLTSNTLYPVVYLMTSELFPSALRGTSFGVTNIFRRVEGILLLFSPSILENINVGIWNSISLGPDAELLSERNQGL